MGMYRASHFWAKCSHGDDRGCDAYLLPNRTADPIGYGTILAGQRDVFTLAAQRGWQTPADKDDDTWLCPAHRATPAAKTTVTEVLL